jgi:dTDP-4-amino-4,6-dideoxygalactose transaminase
MNDMNVPLVDLRAAFAPVKDEVFREFEAILDGMQLFQGPNTLAFEEEFAAYCGAAHGMALSNGTDALFAALLACGIGPGDEVIAPAHTFFATIEAIVHAVAVPVLADVERDTLTLDPEQVRALVTEKTRAIVPVHLYGQAADMDPLLEIAREHGLRVVEDAAQAHGAKYKGRPCGSLGDAASFSFYFTKNLGGVGEGGFVSTNDAEIAEQVRLLRHHGHVSKFEHSIIGYNLRIDELQSAVLRAKLPRLDAGNAQRRAHAARYDALFADARVTRPVARPEREHVYHCYALRAPRRDELAVWLGERGVGTGIHYKNPGHLQPGLQHHPHRAGDMKVTSEACRELISLPMYPELTDEQVEYVAARVREFLERGP